MIRRRSGDSYILITQREHAHLAAEIAPAVGGAFAPPSNPEWLEMALRLHSIGMEPLDAAPPLSAAGRPANFDELPVITLLNAWSTSVEKALSAGAYPAMLVSLLCLQRTAAIAAGACTIKENFEINRVQHRQVELQEQLRPQLGLRQDRNFRFGLPESTDDLSEIELAFYYDYRLMLLCISLALEICARRKVKAQLAPTPAAPSAESITVACDLLNPARCVLFPFPLKSPLELNFTGRRVSARIYDHEMELLEELEHAQEVKFHVTIADS